MAEITIKTNGKDASAVFEGTIIAGASTEETLNKVLLAINAFSDKFTAGIKDTKIGTEKTHSAIGNVLNKLGFGGIISTSTAGGAAAGATNATGVIGKVLSPILTSLGGDSGIFGLLGGIAELTPEVLLAVVAFKAISFAVKAFQEVLNFISRTITSVFWTAGSLINTFVSGKKTMADYFDAIAKGTHDIPILGELVSLLSAGMGVLSGWNNTLVELTAHGANFGGSISNMIMGAADAGVSVEDFSKIIQANSQNLATFGSITEGITVYQKVAKISMKDYATQLADMGISFAQYSEELPKVLSLFGASMKAHGASDKELAQSAFELTQQFDAMSQISGKTRSEQADDLAKMQDDAAVQEALSHMSKDQAERFNQAWNQMDNTVGDSTARMAKLAILGIVPLEKSLGAAEFTISGLPSDLEELRNSVYDTSLSQSQFNNKLDDITVSMADKMVKTGAGFETLAKAISAGGAFGEGAAGITTAQRELRSHIREFIDQTTGELKPEQFRQFLANARKRHDIEENVQKQLLNFSNLMTLIQERFNEKVLGPLVNKFGPIISNIVNALQNDSRPLDAIMNNIVSILMDFGNWMKKHSVEIKTDIQDFFTIITSIISAIVTVTKFIIEHWTTIKKISEVILLPAIVGLVTIVGLIASLFIVLAAPLIAVITAFTAISIMLVNLWHKISTLVPSNWFSDIIGYTPSNKSLLEPEENKKVNAAAAKLETSTPSNQNVLLDIHNELKKHSEKLDSISNATSNTADASSRTSRLTKQIAQTA